MLGGGGADRRAIVLLSATINSPSTRAVLERLSGALPGLPARRPRPDVAGGAARGEPALPSAPPSSRISVSTGRASSSRWRRTFSGPGWRRWSSPDSGRAAAPPTAPADSMSSSSRDFRSRAATPTCGWRSPPRSSGPVAVALLAAVARRLNQHDGSLAALNAAGLAQTAPHAADIDRVADALARHRGESLVVTRQRRRRDCRSWSRKLNALLGNIGGRQCDSPIDLARPSLQRQGDDARRARADRRHGPRRGAARSSSGAPTRSTTTRTALAFREGARQGRR